MSLEFIILGLILSLLFCIITLFLTTVTDSTFLALFIPAIIDGIILIMYRKYKAKKQAIAEENKQININKGATTINEQFRDLFNSAPTSSSMYNIVTIQDTTLNLYLGKFKIWKEDNIVKILAVEDAELQEAIGKGKIKRKNQLSYNFNIDKVSFFEKEDKTQIVSDTFGGGSHYSIWTGNEKVGRIYTTHREVGNKCTLLYIENHPADTKIMFDYEDYSALKRILGK